MSSTSAIVSFPVDDNAELAPATLLSFVWVCNDASVDLQRAVDAFLAAAQEVSVRREFIIVNNGIEAKQIEQVIETIQVSKTPLTLVTLHETCPDSMALSSGFRHAKGDLVAVLPSYLQSDPSAINLMLETLKQGYDYVATVRSPRVDSNVGQRQSRWFNRLVSLISGVRLHDINSGLRLMRRDVAAGVPIYGDLHIYLPILAAKQGYLVGEVPVRHMEERSGRGTAGFGFYLKRILDLLTLFFLIRFTQKPFRFFGGIGTGLFVSGGVITLVLGVQRLLMNKSLADRPMLVLGTLLIALGIQLFSLGLIGELIIFVQAGGMKDYHIRQIIDAASTVQSMPSERAPDAETT